MVPTINQFCIGDVMMFQISFKHIHYIVILWLCLSIIIIVNIEVHLIVKVINKGQISHMKLISVVATLKAGRVGGLQRLVKKLW